MTSTTDSSRYRRSRNPSPSGNEARMDDVDTPLSPDDSANIARDPPPRNYTPSRRSSYFSRSATDDPDGLFRASEGTIARLEDDHAHATMRVERMRDAGRLVGDVLSELATHVAPGVSTGELDVLVGLDALEPPTVLGEVLGVPLLAYLSGEPHQCSRKSTFVGMIVRERVKAINAGAKLRSPIGYFGPAGDPSEHYPVS